MLLSRTSEQSSYLRLFRFNFFVLQPSVHQGCEPGGNATGQQPIRERRPDHSLRHTFPREALGWEETASKTSPFIKTNTDLA